jgi:hypothetical protein
LFDIDSNTRIKWRLGSWQQQIADDEYVGEPGIHSVQNGILMDRTVHAFFDKYIIAINPDVSLIISIRFSYFRFLTTGIIQINYKIFCFVAGQLGFDGLKMFRNPDAPAKHQPSRELLRHHFQMAVLYNMKGGAGLPEWDEDMPAGYDPIAEVTNSEQGKLRLETILAGKLNNLIS